MLKDLIKYFAIMGLIMALSCVSYAGNEISYEVELHKGESINLESYIYSQEIPFQLTAQTSIQNLNASVLEVKQNKYIKAKDIGKGILILGNGNQQITLHINVVLPITKIELAESNLSLLLGEIHKIDYTVLSTTAHNNINNYIKWSSSKPRIASIRDNDTIVTAAAGTVTITAMTSDGQILTTFDVTVIAHSETLEIKNNTKVRQLNVGETLTLQAMFGTKDVTRNVDWISVTPHVLKVDEEGVITAIGQGRGEIKAQSSQQMKKDTYTIESSSMIDKVELNKKNIQFLAVGQTDQLYFNLYPKNKSIPPILMGYRYVSSNNEVATVSENGLVTAKGPGVTLISVIFDDSQKRASCTVEVPSNDRVLSDAYVPVDEIQLEAYSGTALIGEKIKLDYVISPTNATEKQVSFKVNNGDDNQIRRVDGIYYFIPEKRGSTLIEVKTLDGHKDQIKISVTSPIDSMDLSLSSRRIVGTNEELLYVGECAEILNRIYVRSGYNKEDVFDTSLRYEVKNPEILELVSKGSDYYVKALKKGKTEVSVQTIEGMHKTTLWIEVDNSTKSIESDDEVVLPIGTEYKPRIYDNQLPTAEPISEIFELDDLATLIVEDVYISSMFIENEISYETDQINSFGIGPYNAENQEVLSEHEARLKRLYTYKDRLLDGYVLYDPLNPLYDRNGKRYRFYTINDLEIVSNYPIKVMIKISVGKFNCNSMLTWSDNLESFSIKRGSSNYEVSDLIQQYGLAYSLMGREVDEQIALMVTYLRNYELFDKIPSYDVLMAKKKIDDNDLSSIGFGKLSAQVTKTELAKLSVALHKKYINRYLISNEEAINYYYDVVDSDLADAISLGHVHPNSIDWFGSNDFVTERDFYEMIKDMLPSIAFDESITDKALTHEKMLLLLGEILY